MRRLSKLGIGILFATGLGMAASPAFAQSPDIHHDRRDIRHDRRDILSDRQNIHNKRADLHNDYQTLKQNRATLRNDVKNGVSSDQVTADRQAVHNQVKDIRGDQRGVLQRPEGCDAGPQRPAQRSTRSRTRSSRLMKITPAGP